MQEVCALKEGIKCPHEEVNKEFRQRTDSRLEKLENFQIQTGVNVEKIIGSVQKVELTINQMSKDSQQAVSIWEEKLEEITKGINAGLNSYDKRVKFLEEREDRRIANGFRKALGSIGTALIGALSAGIIAFLLKIMQMVQ